ncbi:hypothetical protein ACJMK2_004640 [Sinanodonta woodiana]|uniref:Uncharacterized protein n=1 Tax=Sinanodonta woodiana TaxID=1069815 RepID=A0ABD3Y3K7_SINWO
MSDDQQEKLSDGDKNELLMHNLANSDGVPQSSGGYKAEASSLRKPKKVLEAGKAILADQSKGLKIIVACCIGFSVIITVALVLSIYLGKPQIGAHGAVASDVEECSEIGLNMLKMGGNAVDAAIAGMFCVGVVNAQSSGLGGGGFMLIHDHRTMKSEVIDFRETAPKALTAQMFTSKEMMYLGGLSVGVPGELRGMEAAHKKYGKLDWKYLVSPSADLARNGFKMTGAMDKIFKQGKVSLSRFLNSNLAKYYTDNGQFLTEGSTIKRPDLAHTLDRIATEGVDVFYKGNISDHIIAAVKGSVTPGVLKNEDLNNYKVESRTPVKSTYQGKTIETVPAPGSGPILLSILNIIERIKPQKDSAESYHSIIEVFKFAFAQQQLLADPEFELSVVNSTLKIISQAEADRLYNITSSVNMTNSDPTFYEGSVQGSLLDSGASHISVIDSQELMVSVTTSINTWFGSLILTDDGILLNNQMAAFTFPASGQSSLNDVKGGKRPLSNMAPAVLYDSDNSCGLRLVLGGANGSRLLTGVAQVIINNVTFGMNFDAAVLYSRIHTNLYPNATVVECEESFPQKIITGLKEHGHNIMQDVEGLNEVQDVKLILFLQHLKMTLHIIQNKVYKFCAFCSNIFEVILTKSTLDKYMTDADPITLDKYMTDAHPITLDKYMTDADPITLDKYMTDADPITLDKYMTDADPITLDKYMTDAHPITLDKYMTDANPLP